MSQNFPRDNSGPGSLHQAEDDETFDKEFDKVFHNEKEKLPNLNPSSASVGEIDQERKTSYIRSVSQDETGGAEERPTASGDDGNEPLQDQRFKLVASEGAFRMLEGEHSTEDFAHNNPIMTKRKTSSGKRKTSEDKSGKSIKKASTASFSLQGIPEGQILAEEGPGEPGTDQFPWKGSRHDEPVVYTEEAEEEQEQQKQAGGVKFSIGADADDDVDDNDDAEEEHHKEKGHRPHRHHKKTSRTEKKQSQDFVMLADESGHLQEADLEEIAGHRFEKLKQGSRHPHPRKAVFKIGREDVAAIGKERAIAHLSYGFRDDCDHTPHALFIEMDELEGEEWEERARWIKYEEDLEAEKGEWGKPHVSSLTFHSLINLRLAIEGGTFLLDLSVNDLPSLVHRVVEDLSEKDIIQEELKEKVLRVLLYRHKHVHPHDKTFKLGLGLTRSSSQRSMQSLVEETQRRFSTAQKENVKLDSLNSMENGFANNNKDSQSLVGANGLKRSATQSSSMRKVDSFENVMKARSRDIIACLDDGTEGAIVLVGAMDEIDKPIVAFVRLAEAIVMANTIEVSLPVRFIFILLTPSKNFNMDPHEIGRSFSTLMSNPSFALVAYKVEEKQEMLHAINTFLDDSVVLPPGDWDRKHILPINEIMEMRQRRKERKDMKDGVVPTAAETSKKVEEKKGDDEPPKRDPLQRTGIPFGGLIDDIKYRYPLYWSDIKDGLNAQCLASTIFIYFACLSGAIAFGSLMAEKTNNAIGVSETLIISCVSGVIFSLFAGCPLIIIGSTGPMLLFDVALFDFCSKNLPGQFLYWRTWVGIWVFIISLVVAGFQGSTLVKVFTKFIKDVFATLISIVFIVSAIEKLAKIFAEHPLQALTDYCTEYDNLPACVERSNSTDNATAEEDTNMWSNATDADILYCDAPGVAHRGSQPNTALLSAILMFGCFFIAYFLRLFRNSQYLGRNARRALGDFGVPIAIVIMVLLDYGAGDTFTQKLKIPDGVSVTDASQRGWFIPPLGTAETPIAVWAVFAAALPAFLLYMLIFIETAICELIMMEKTKQEKGAGLHLDIVLLALINMGCGLFGGPWICAATVRAVAHVSSLTVFAASHIPGEPNKAIGVRDQRVTFCVVSALLGVSVVLGPLLKQVPNAVLFGVFLYMGVSGLNGIQFYDRILLFFMPVKHHPSVSYTKRVKTWRMVLFTVLQAIGLAILWGVSKSDAALAFPFFVVGMIPYRWCFKFIFNPVELDALDGPNAGQSYEKDSDELDFYELANAMPEVHHEKRYGLHKSLMGIVNFSHAIGDTTQKK